MESQADALNQLAGDELEGKVAIFLIIYLTILSVILVYHILFYLYPAWINGLTVIPKFKKQLQSFACCFSRNVFRTNIR